MTLVDKQVQEGRHVSFRSLPPMRALRGFEASARLMSFTLAAEELHLTQGAVSRQIRELEDLLGVRLFHRFIRRIELTERGAAYYKMVEFILTEIEQATTTVAQSNGVNHLQVSVLPSVATFWLMPKLHLFAEKNPGIQVQLSTLSEPVNFCKRELDIAIRVGRLPGREYDGLQPRIPLVMTRDWEGVLADELFEDVLTPICSPSLLKGANDISTPEDLLKYPLIHVSTRKDAWRDWMRAQGVQCSFRDQRSLTFGHFFMAFEAARSGRGIAIVPEVLLENYEARGELLRPLQNRIASAGAYYLLVKRDRLSVPGLRQFRQWVLQEAERYQAGVGETGGLRRSPIRVRC